jgi:hypothetical protein
MPGADELLKNSNAVVFYFAVLLVLVFLCVYHLRNMSKAKEHLIGSGITEAAAPFTSGATMRRLGQDFSATNQGEQTTVYNAEIKELVPDAVGKKERLVNERGEPDFWEISRELGAYKDSQVGGMAADAAGKERMSGIGAMVEEQRLSDLLGR